MNKRKPGILVSPKLLKMIAAAPVTTKRPRLKPPFKERLIAVLERHIDEAGL